MEVVPPPTVAADVGKERLRDTKCCATRPEDKDFPGSNEVMYVDCKDGKMVPTVAPGKKAATYVDGAKKCKVFNCLEEHEKQHITQFTRLCPKACKGVKGKQRHPVAFDPAGIKGAICLATGECFAYPVGIMCMIKRACEIKAALDKKAGDETLEFCFNQMVVDKDLKGPTVIQGQIDQMNAYCKSANLDASKLVANID